MYCAGERGQWHPQLCGTQGVEEGSTYAAKFQHGKDFCKNGSKMPNDTEGRDGSGEFWPLNCQRKNWSLLIWFSWLELGLRTMNLEKSMNKST